MRMAATVFKGSLLALLVKRGELTAHQLSTSAENSTNSLLSSMPFSQTWGGKGNKCYTPWLLSQKTYKAFFVSENGGEWKYVRLMRVFTFHIQPPCLAFISL